MMALLARALRGAPLLLVFIVSACGGGFTRSAPPPEGWRDAVSPVTPVARFWGDAPPADADQRKEAFLEQFFARRAAQEARGEPFSFNILALSGGAADGAYGAGVLVGWTAAGDRPEFDLVTGVSTGALIAPLAFLGPEYDDELEVFFTETSTDDLLETAIFRALTGGLLGLADPTGLEAAIAEVVTPDFIDAVAREHRAGRRLYIATTNLDARRSVIWDMGEIAAQGGPEALKLFREVMLASASIPGAFPPVYIEVDIDGRRYTELHVDGGVVTSVFIAPNWLQLDGVFADMLAGNTTVYVIQNNKLTPPYAPIEDGLVEIASSSISEMIRNQARGDQLRIFAIAQANGFKYRTASVPTDFDVRAEELFDPVYMRALFDVGYAQMSTGEVWMNSPPDLPSTILRQTAAREVERALPVLAAE